MNTLPVPDLSVRLRLFDDVAGKRVRLLAFAELTIAGAFVIKSIRVLAKREGTPEERIPFVVFPAERRRRGSPAESERWYDLAHPITPDARAAALRAILTAYGEAKAAPA